jgi:hypothetical protein
MKRKYCLADPGGSYTNLARYAAYMAFSAVYAPITASAFFHE